ncbi:MAG: helix-turn-helix transcriptional regulator [Fimbriimonadaceae bacterium]|nr:helix-turn-helix transcriptional regulator [Fimbriimonadaceae bacterium]
MTDEMTKASLKALADPTRLHIVEFLSQMCCGRAPVREDGGVEGPSAGEVCCHITGADKINSTISHHLHELELAGLVNLERRGRVTVCSLRPEGLRHVASTLAALADGVSSPCCEEPGKTTMKPTKEHDQEDMTGQATDSAACCGGGPDQSGCCCGTTCTGSCCDCPDC